MSVSDSLLWREGLQRSRLGVVLAETFRLGADSSPYDVAS